VSPQDRVAIVRFGLAEGGVDSWPDVFLLGLAYVLLIQRVAGLPAMAACVPPLAAAMLGVLLADVLLEIAAQTAATVDPGDRACAKALRWRHDHQMPIEFPNSL